MSRKEVAHPGGARKGGDNEQYEKKNCEETYFDVFRVCIPFRHFFLTPV
jgi:hypothetical protein